MSEELKACPFCAGAKGNDDIRSHREDCFIRMLWEFAVRGEKQFTESELAEAWNIRRVPQSILTARGEPMPQTVEAWQHWGDLVESKMLEQRDEIGRLKSKVNNLHQKLRGKEGYALVPVEPTKHMLERVNMEWEGSKHISHRIIQIYRAMIAASQK